MVGNIKKVEQAIKSNPNATIDYIAEVTGIPERNVSSVIKKHFPNRYKLKDNDWIFLLNYNSNLSYAKISEASKLGFNTTTAIATKLRQKGIIAPRRTGRKSTEKLSGIDNDKATYIEVIDGIYKGARGYITKVNSNTDSVYIYHKGKELVAEIEHLFIRIIRKHESAIL